MSDSIEILIRSNESSELSSKTDLDYYTSNEDCLLDQTSGGTPANLIYDHEQKEKFHEEECCSIPNQIKVQDGQSQEKCTIKGFILNQTVVNIEMITIKLDICQPRSMFDRKLKDFLKPSCFKNKDIAELTFWITSLEGNHGLTWNFDTSHNLEVDCILGSDFLSNINNSPIKAIKAGIPWDKLQNDY